MTLVGPASALDLEQTQLGIALHFDRNARPHSLALGLIDATRDPTDTEVRARFSRAVSPALSYDFAERELSLSPGLERSWLGNRIEIFIGKRPPHPR